MKKCPFCAEEIQDEAIKCRFCMEMISNTIVKPTVKEDVLPNRAYVEMKKSKHNFWTVLRWILFVPAGLVIALGGIGICFTVVGLPVGISFFVIGAAMFALGIGTVKAICPYCEGKNSFLSFVNHFKCRKCKEKVIVRWKNEPKEI